MRRRRWRVGAQVDVAGAGGAGGFDIYRAVRPDRGSPFGPLTLDAELSTTDDDLNLALSADGLVAVVDRDTAGQGRELYAYTRPSPGASWSGPVHLAELGTSADDASPALDAHGLVILFQSNRSGGSGDNDLYTASRASTSDPFSAPAPISELNTSSGDSNPFVGADLRRIVLSRGPGSRDLYEATR